MAKAAAKRKPTVRRAKKASTTSSRRKRSVPSAGTADIPVISRSTLRTAVVERGSEAAPNSLLTNLSSVSKDTPGDEILTDSRFVVFANDGNGNEDFDVMVDDSDNLNRAIDSARDQAKEYAEEEQDHTEVFVYQLVAVVSAEKPPVEATTKVKRLGPSPA